ncbi:MAG: cyclic nucleotide-binding domain-containing protein [Proteobacteria bacterium]|nr:cyclic nucleotide-binding domain-containing protein [Pseudomonadota bacterium]
MERSVKSQELGGTELLAALDQGALDALAVRCGWKAYDKGEQILSRDSDSGEVYFVVDGEVGVVNFSLGGCEIAYTSIGDGNYFGEMAAIDGEPRS